MVRYVPRFADGSKVKLAWPLALFRHNHIFWPLDPSTGKWRRYVDYLMAFLGCLLFVQHNDAELRYLRREAANLNFDAFLTGMPTYLILVEAQFRSLHILLHSHELQRFLQRFYTKIYVDPRLEGQVFRQIDNEMRLNRLVSAMYAAVITGYLISPISSIINRRKDFLYSMIFPFDTQSLLVFIPLLLTNVWVGLIIDSMMFGETNLLCELIGHLNGRYLLLKRDLDREIHKILMEGRTKHMARELKELLVQTLRKNVELNNFAEQLEQQYTVRVFIMFAFAAGLLCALSFKAYTNPVANYIYAIWFGAKTVELLALGHLGSNLAYTTENLGSMYYHTQWEEILLHSTNHQENLRLLKLITISIEMNYKPFYVTGLNYFRVSIQAGLKILQGAFSYFTFLTSMQRRQMTN